MVVSGLFLYPSFTPNYSAGLHIRQVFLATQPLDRQVKTSSLSARYRAGTWSVSQTPAASGLCRSTRLRKRLNRSSLLSKLITIGGLAFLPEARDWLFHPLIVLHSCMIKDIIMHKTFHREVGGLRGFGSKRLQNCSRSRATIQVYNGPKNVIISCLVLSISFSWHSQTVRTFHPSLFNSF